MGCFRAAAWEGAIAWGWDASAAARVMGADCVAPLVPDISSASPSFASGVVSAEGVAVVAMPPVFALTGVGPEPEVANAEVPGREAGSDSCAFSDSAARAEASAI